MTNIAPINIAINGVNITTKPKNESSTYLGIEINANLDWSSHVSKVIRKARNGLFALRKIRQISNTKSKKMVYEALIKPHITYGLSVWGPTCKACDLKSILSIQKAAVRVINNAGRLGLDHSEPLFKTSGILKVQELITTSSLGLIMAIQSVNNNNNNLRNYIKITETKTRSGYSLTPTTKGKTIRSHITSWVGFQDIVDMPTTKKTRKRWIRERLLSNYACLLYTSPSPRDS